MGMCSPCEYNWLQWKRGKIGPLWYSDPINSSFLCSRQATYQTLLFKCPSISPHHRCRGCNFFCDFTSIADECRNWLNTKCKSWSFSPEKIHKTKQSRITSCSFSFLTHSTEHCTWIMFFCLFSSSFHCLFSFIFSSDSAIAQRSPCGCSTLSVVTWGSSHVGSRTGIIR